MECPVCYTSKAKCRLVCSHSFCYQCIIHWYQECKNNTCPVCRQDIQLETLGDVREVHIQCTSNAEIENYNQFHKLLEKYAGLKIKDVAYLRRQDWVKWVMEYRAKNQKYTKYIFYGLQGTKKACYQERQEEQETCVFAKTHKD